MGEQYKIPQLLNISKIPNDTTSNRRKSPNKKVFQTVDPLSLWIASLSLKTFLTQEFAIQPRKNRGRRVYAQFHGHDIYLLASAWDCCQTMLQRALGCPSSCCPLAHCLCCICGDCHSTLPATPLLLPAVRFSLLLWQHCWGQLRCAACCRGSLLRTPLQLGVLLMSLLALALTSEGPMATAGMPSKRDSSLGSPWTLHSQP